MWSSTGRPASSPRLAESMLYFADELKDGSPSIYKLRMREETRSGNSMIARQSIGRPLPRNASGREQNEKILLVVGAEGAGKSTLINGMVNYILGVEWKDDFRFKLITEDDKRSQAENQTGGITAYTFRPPVGAAVPHTFTIIDTPSFGSTEGLERDKEITEKIKQFFFMLRKQGINHLNGIAFVIPASQARLTKTQKCMFDSILSILKKPYENRVATQHIFMMLTFADGQQPPVLEAIGEASRPYNSYVQQFFKFNNSALFSENRIQNKGNFNEMFWKMGLSSVENFFKAFSDQNREPLSTAFL